MTATPIGFRLSSFRPINIARMAGVLVGHRTGQRAFQRQTSNSTFYHSLGDDGTTKPAVPHGNRRGGSISYPVGKLVPRYGKPLAVYLVG